MFDAISQTTKVEHSENAAPKTALVKPIDPPSLQQVKKVEEKKVEAKAEAKAEAKEPKVTQELLDELERDLDTIHNVGLTFSLHEKTGRTIVKVINKESKEVIREIPSEEILNLVAKLDEMMGILFDKFG